MNCQEKMSHRKFYSRIKFFSNCVKIFCPTYLKIFVHLARPCLAAFSTVFSVLLAAYDLDECFPYCFTCYNLFNHIILYVAIPRMIFDSFLATQRVTSRGNAPHGRATEQPVQT